jgi:hypothetical protein
LASLLLMAKPNRAERNATSEPATERRRRAAGRHEEAVIQAEVRRLAAALRHRPRYAARRRGATEFGTTCLPAEILTSAAIGEIKRQRRSDNKELD